MSGVDTDFAYELTDARDEDRAFVLSTWCKSYREEHKKSLPASTYFDWQRARMDKILARNPLVVVARDSDQPLFLYGYGVFERIDDAFVAHWVYVKNGPAAEWRKKGVAKDILREALERIGGGAQRLLATHRTYIETDHGVATRLGFKLVPLEKLYRGSEEAA